MYASRGFPEVPLQFFAKGGGMPFGVDTRFSHEKFDEFPDRHPAHVRQILGVGQSSQEGEFVSLLSVSPDPDCFPLV